jgi:hypothetical protein
MADFIMSVMLQVDGFQAAAAQCHRVPIFVVIETVAGQDLLRGGFFHDGESALAEIMMVIDWLHDSYNQRVDALAQCRASR